MDIKFYQNLYLFTEQVAFNFASRGPHIVSPQNVNY